MTYRDTQFNATDSFGNTLLHYAIMSVREDSEKSSVLHRLLEGGADPNFLVNINLSLNLSIALDQQYCILQQKKVK